MGQAQTALGSSTIRVTVSAADAANERPLVSAASEGQLELVRLLLEAGADKNVAATAATPNGHFEVLCLLR